MPSHGAQQRGCVFETRPVAGDDAVALHVEAGSGARPEFVIVAQPGHGFDRTVERVAQVTRVGQDVAQPLRCGLGVAQEAEIVAVFAEMLFQSSPVEQTHIRVLPLPEPLEDGRQEDAVDARGT